MSADSRYWQEIIQSAVETAETAFRETYDYIVGEFVPALTTKATLEERAAFFAQLDWQALRTNAPELWKMLSQQAIEVERQMMRKQSKQRAVYI